MENLSLSSNNISYINWCIPWTKPIYLYGHLIPAIAVVIFGLTFNPIALYYFATSRNFYRSVYSYYFSSIAVFDLVRLIVWSLFLLLDYKIFKLKFHSFQCPMQIFSESVASSISAWLTVALTVERCLVIYKPLQTLNDTKNKRAIIVILSVILVSCAVNSLFLTPGFYEKRVYEADMRTILCYFEQVSTGNTTENKTNSILTPNIKLIYQLFIIIFRVVIPFMLLLTTNVVLFINIRNNEKQSSKTKGILLVRHGHHRQITPMILFSSCILLLTVSPRYLHQFSVNFFQKYLNCSFFHLVPHLLKTLELFNYSFNVFVSIVSGKHGRHELFNMLLCQTKNLHLKLNSPSIHHSSVLVKTQYQQRLDNRIGEQVNSTHRPLLANSSSCY